MTVGTPRTFGNTQLRDGRLRAAKVRAVRPGTAGPWLALALAAGLAAGAAGAEPVGFLAVAEGDVAIQASGATSYAAASLDQEVEIGDTVRTGRDSLAKIVLVDDTMLTIDEETELEIDRYVVGPAATAEPSRIRLLGGHVRAVVGEAFGGPTRLEMHTPTAVIGVKGTEWLTWYLRESRLTIVCVVSGNVEVQNPAVGGIVEPPVGTCSEVLPHLRPRPAELPPDMKVVAPGARAAAPPPPPPVPAVAAAPGVTSAPVAVDAGVGGASGEPPPVSDTLDSFSVGTESREEVEELAEQMQEPAMEPPPMEPEPDPPPFGGPGTGAPSFGGPGTGTGE